MPQINCFNKVTMTPMAVLDPVMLVASYSNTFMADPDLDVITNVERVYWKVESDTLLEMNQSEKDVVDGVRLPALKTTRGAAVDVRTAELIAEGFDYSDVHFSLSSNAQKNWNRLYSKHLADKLTYPVTISSSDLSVQHQLADVAALEAFYSAMDGGINTHIASGQALKIQVFVAATKDALDAIVDPR